MKNTAPFRSCWTDSSKVVISISCMMLLTSVGIHVYQHDQADGLERSLQNEQAGSKRHELAYNVAVQERVQLEQRHVLLQEEAHEQETRRIEAEAQLVTVKEQLKGLAAVRLDLEHCHKQAQHANATDLALQLKFSEVQDDLQSMVEERAELRRRVNELRNELEQAAANTARVDGSLAEAYRGNKERLTVLARKTRKLQLSLILPPSIAKSVTYAITTPEGELIHGDDPSVSIIRSPEPGPSLASGGRGADLNGGERVKLVYIPKKRLEPGIYKVEVFNAGQHIGTTYLGLR